MANYKILVPYIKSWEGGYVNHPNDRGGATNMGVTIGTFRHFFGADRTVTDLKNMTPEQWDHIFIKGYWNKVMGDQINSQSIANMMCDWYWASGATAVKKLQQVLGLTADGIFGPKTLAAVNDQPAELLFNRLKIRRQAFYEAIVKNNPSQAVFLKGWMRRLNHMSFGELLNNGKTVATKFEE